MITWTYDEWKSTLIGYGLSTDTAPTEANKPDNPPYLPYTSDGIPNGSKLVRMDTSEIELYNKDDDEWETWGTEETASE